jgi:hypothetical protein
MAPQTRQQEREESSRLSLRTLVIASAASATAAIVTSQFWIRGTWIAAAMTPVIVALVQELLHRPTARIAGALTADRAALEPDAGAHVRVREQLGDPDGQAAATERLAREEAARGAEAAEAPVRVYTTERRARRSSARRRLAVGTILVTGFLGFAIAAAALTIPELIAGRSLSRGDRATTIVPVRKHSSSQPATPTETGTGPQAQPPPTTPSTPETTPSTPQGTTSTPAPATPPPSRQRGGQPAPAPAAP